MSEGKIESSNETFIRKMCRLCPYFNCQEDGNGEICITHCSHPKNRSDTEGNTTVELCPTLSHVGAQVIGQKILKNVERSFTSDEAERKEFESWLLSVCRKYGYTSNVKFLFARNPSNRYELSGLDIAWAAWQTGRVAMTAENAALKKENLELKQLIQNNLQTVANNVQQFMIDRIAEGETKQKVLSEIKYDILKLSVTSQPSSQLVIDRGQVLAIVGRYIND